MARKKLTIPKEVKAKIKEHLTESYPFFPPLLEFPKK